MSTKPNAPAVREWWIQPYNIGAHAFTYKTADDDVHVIEYKAYQALQKELEEVKAGLNNWMNHHFKAEAELERALKRSEETVANLETELSQLRERNKGLEEKLTSLKDELTTAYMLGFSNAKSDKGG